MATIVEPGDREVIREVHHDHYADSDSGLGTIIGVILALIVIAILLFYGLPLFRSALNRGGTTSGTLNVNVQGLPGAQSGANGASTGGTTTP
jgi:hypothetical protein